MTISDVPLLRVLVAVFESVFAQAIAGIYLTFVGALLQLLVVGSLLNDIQNLLGKGPVLQSVPPIEVRFHP